MGDLMHRMARCNHSKYVTFRWSNILARSSRLSLVRNLYTSSASKSRRLIFETMPTSCALVKCLDNAATRRSVAIEIRRSKGASSEMPPSVGRLISSQAFCGVSVGQNLLHVYDLCCFRRVKGMKEGITRRCRPTWRR